MQSLIERVSKAHQATHAVMIHNKKLVDELKAMIRSEPTATRLELATRALEHIDLDLFYLTIELKRLIEA